ncbi:oxidoreductase [Mesorhizobium sp. ESP-6-4]|uniref:oxidoreductase n=1 Tax=Mesorhizobium sp. ESP-6-4 TaxID=2876624 RepID=UPI001CC93242|nr:oxidoreductase [Mesorhizobium sp. ESP-6-4]MBZ9659810.1 oxidoreductase [Mesorhizobium sp. ESP-6-4]
MAPLPKPTASTVRAIYKAYEDNAESRDGRSISVSTLAEECERKLYYDFRWVSPQEVINGRTLRIFESGNIEEERWIENLRMIGCEVVDRDDNGKQIMVEACGGHVRGYLDSEILGLPEAPKTIHVGEIKSHNAKSFAKLVKEGVRVAKPLHYGQIQTYMYRRGRDRGIYLAVCKDTDELYAERLELNVEFVVRLLARAQRIIDAGEPPAKLHEDPNHKMAFACGWCRHKPICHDYAPARVNCRTCLYSTPEDGGSWSCARFSKPLSIDEQAAGCPAHLTIPGLVAGEQIDADEDAETVTYRMYADGRLWTDGANDNKEAA